MAQTTDTLDDGYMMCLSRNGELAAALRSHPLVAAANPDSLSCADAIAAELQRLGRVLTCGDAYKLHPLHLLPAVPSRADTVLTTRLGKVACKLVRGDYTGQPDHHSCVAVGPRGGGKSMALQRFALSAAVLFPTLRVVYLDCAAFANEAHPLHSNHLIDVLWDALWPSPAVAGGGGGGDGRGRTACDLTEELARRDLQCIVLLDTMELLYEHESTLQVLQDIDDIATNDGGRMALLGCSSSSLLYPMVKGALPDGLHALFPVAARPGVPYMEVAQIEIPSDLPTLVAAAQASCAPGGDPKVLLFASGALPRSLSHRDAATKRAPVHELARMPTKETPAFLAAYPSTVRLLTMLYDALVLVNAALLLELVACTLPGCAAADGSGAHSREWAVDANKVASVDWLSRFRPLAYGVVADIVRRLNMGTGTGTGASEYRYATAAADRAMLKFLQHDVGFIAVSGQGYEARVYPCSLNALLAHVRYRNEWGALGVPVVAAHLAVADGENWRAARALMPTLVSCVAAAVATACTCAPW